MSTARFLCPEWPAPPNVKCLVTTRSGGVSRAPYDGFNLALHVGDDPKAVAANRQRLCGELPAAPLWLEQVHGVDVVDIALRGGACESVPVADASLARTPGRVCVVMTADCLPVLLCDVRGTVVAAVHAGWRGLAAGVLESTVSAMGVPSDDLLAWLGPGIGPDAFEVGDEVRAQFVAADASAARAFRAGERAGKWRADLYQLAQNRLNQAGVEQIYGGGLCTFSDADRFYSYRRDGVTGRFASLIWLGV